MNDEKEVVCSGKMAAPFIMGVMSWLIGIGARYARNISYTMGMEEFLCKLLKREIEIADVEKIMT